MPVALPPGRLRLATRPSLTGSSPLVKTMGMVEVAALAARADAHGRSRRAQPPAAHQIGGQRGQSVISTVGPAVFDFEILPFDVAGLVEALAKRVHVMRILDG